MSKWKYVYESICLPCAESGDEIYGEIYDSKMFDTKEEAEAYLEKRGGYKNHQDDYASTVQYIEEIIEESSQVGDDYDFSTSSEVGSLGAVK